MSNTHTHEDWAERLSDYLDGDLAGADAEALEDHLASCSVCRDELAELREVVAAARGLGEVQPPRDLWAGIAAAIAAPLGGAKVIKLPTAHEAQAGPAGLFLSRRQLAAAASILMLVSASATWAVGLGLPGSSSAQAEGPPAVSGAAQFAAETASPPESMARELESLESLMAEARTVMDPATVRILEKNLAVIEVAIEDSYRALALEPENAFLAAHLERAFQRKVDYLNNVAQVAGWAG